MNNLVILLIIIVGLASLTVNVNVRQESTQFLFPKYRDSYLYNRNMEYFAEDTENNEEKEEDSKTMKKVKGYTSGLLISAGSRKKSLEESETVKKAKGYTRGLLIAAGAREKSSEELDLEKKIKDQEKKKEIAKEKAAYAKEIRQKTIQSAKKI